MADAGVTNVAGAIGMVSTERAVAVYTGVARRVSAASIEHPTHDSANKCKVAINQGVAHAQKLRQQFLQATED